MIKQKTLINEQYQIIFGFFGAKSGSQVEITQSGSY